MCWHLFQIMGCFWLFPKIGSLVMFLVFPVLNHVQYASFLFLRRALCYFGCGVPFEPFCLFFYMQQTSHSPKSVSMVTSSLCLLRLDRCLIQVMMPQQVIQSQKRADKRQSYETPT